MKKMLQNMSFRIDVRLKSCLTRPKTRFEAASAEGKGLKNGHSVPICQMLRCVIISSDFSGQAPRSPMI